jgi:hypothetical protein
MMCLQELYLSVCSDSFDLVTPVLSSCRTFKSQIALKLPVLVDLYGIRMLRCEFVIYQSTIHPNLVGLRRMCGLSPLRKPH